MATHVSAYVTHTGAYTRSLSLVRARARALSLSRFFSLFRVQSRSSAYITGLRTHTRGFAHARVKNEGSERGTGRTARREGERKRALRRERDKEEKGRERGKERKRRREKERKSDTRERGRALAGSRHAYMHVARARIPQDCRKNCTGEAQQRANRTARESSALASRVPNHSTTR